MERPSTNEIPSSSCNTLRKFKGVNVPGAERRERYSTTSENEAPPSTNSCRRTPNRCRVADFTHVATFSGVVYVAFVVDTFSRRIVGWSASTTKQTRLVLDALDMGLWQRDRDQQPPLSGKLVHHSDAGSQYTSFMLAEHMEKADIAASIGSVGDAYDNALMESTIDLLETEVIKPQGPWRSLAQVELATAEWTDWYHHTRLHGEIGHLPPAEYEDNHYLSSTKAQVTTSI
ncbi:IS3 family transposase [Streptomyces sanyensis]|uniref:IS3 family transposase n=1 Tax=Streptomyces sanyensis TaxID=568869 RepID=UPI003D78447A